MTTTLATPKFLFLSFNQLFMIDSVYYSSPGPPDRLSSRTLDEASRRQEDAQHCLHQASGT